MRCRKVRPIFWYDMPNKLSAWVKFAHYVLLLFYPFRDEKELLSGFSTLHQNKHGGQRVQVVVNMNKIKFESYVDLVDQAFSQFNENLSQVAIIKLKMMKHQKQNVPMKMIRKTKEEAKNNWSSQLYTKNITIWWNRRRIYSLNLKQREFFNVVYTSAKDHVKYNEHDFEPVHIFLSGGGRAWKFHLVIAIYNAVSKALLYHCKGPEKPIVFLFGRTGISAVNVGGNAIHSGVGVKPRRKLLCLNDKPNAGLRNRLSEVKKIIIGELPMVSSDLWR